MDKIDRIIAFEAGELPEKETIKLFQELIDSGEVWSLQGFYGRTARDLIKSGLCKSGRKPRKDYYGNRVPSPYEVKP